MSNLNRSRKKNWRLTTALYTSVLVVAALGIDTAAIGGAVDPADAVKTASPIKRIIILIGENPRPRPQLRHLHAQGKRPDDQQPAIERHRQRRRQPRPELRARTAVFGSTAAVLLYRRTGDGEESLQQRLQPDAAAHHRRRAFGAECVLSAMACHTPHRSTPTIRLRLRWSPRRIRTSSSASSRCCKRVGPAWPRVRSTPASPVPAHWPDRSRSRVRASATTTTPATRRTASSRLPSSRIAAWPTPPRAIRPAVSTIYSRSRCWRRTRPGPSATRWASTTWPMDRSRTSRRSPIALL